MTPLEVLQQVFGHSAFRGCQGEVIERVMAGGHALVIMPTGMGKSICYQAPALADWPEASGESAELTLVISPLIALMKDQVDALRAKGVDAAYINSSLSREERESRYAAVGEGRFVLVYVTPERFRKAEFREVIRKRSVRLLAVNEAHCISQWGHDFRPDYTRLREIREFLGQPTTIALTATATPDVQKDIVRQLGLRDDEMQLFHEGIDRPNLTLDVEEVWGVDNKIERILPEVAADRLGDGGGILYFTLIRTLCEFSERLNTEGVEHVVYHGDLDRGLRRRLQDRFMHGDDQLVLATPAFGMGIDKEDIRLVLHAELPRSMEAYYQEIGRAGRDGLPSRCLLLYEQADLATQMEFLHWSNPDADFYQRVSDLLHSDLEQIHAFGLEWLQDKLLRKNRHDHRLETVLGMMERYGMIERHRTGRIALLEDLPPELTDTERIDAKRLGDQEKLLALVEYARDAGDDRKKYIHEYFGLPYRGG